jgi:serine/threonine protein kinase
MNILSRISNLKQSMSQKNPRFEDQYDVKQRLGEGSFATVYACTKKYADAECLAVKVFDRTAAKGLRREFRGERNLLSILTPNKYCVQMLDAFESRKFCHIVMEKCGISVQEAACRHTAHELNEQDLAHLFRCMLAGVKHLHECGIVHRDLKPSNLLLAQGSSPSLSDRPLIKICDLGLAAKLPARSGLTEICGTAPYMAPEMLLKKKAYHEGVDVWSCGVIAHLMLLGSYPYRDRCHDPAAVKDAIRLGKPLQDFRARKGFAQPSEAAIKFLALLLQRDPELRPDATRALKSQYMQQLSLLPSSPSSMPSFGPTLTLMSTLTRDEPAAETPVVKDLEDSNDDEGSDSTNCGQSGDDTDEGFSDSLPRLSTSTCDSTFSRINL